MQQQIENVDGLPQSSLQQHPQLLDNVRLGHVGRQAEREAKRDDDNPG